MQIKLINKDSDIYLFQLNKKNYIKFCPKRGGLITNWISEDKNILYFDENRFFDKTKSIRGGIPILFPICGNLDLSYSLFGDKYQKLKQHGFARDIEWQYIFNPEKKSLRLSLQDSEITKRYYPYSFELKIDINLEIDCLNFEVEILNKSFEEMPINFGFHPYFNISQFGNLEFTDYPTNCQDQKTNCLESTISFLENLNEGIDILMYTNGQSSFKDYGFKRKITLIQPKPFDISVIWSDPPRKMVCLEPWTSPRNSLLNGFRKLTIPSQVSKKLFASIQINDL